jgi:hypothetical protein
MATSTPRVRRDRHTTRQDFVGFGGSGGIRQAWLVGEEGCDVDVVEVDKHAPSLGLAPHQERR